MPPSGEKEVVESLRGLEVPSLRHIENLWCRGLDPLGTTVSSARTQGYSDTRYKKGPGLGRQVGTRRSRVGEGVGPPSFGCSRETTLQESWVRNDQVDG